MTDSTEADIVEFIMNRRETLRVASDLGEADPDLTAGMIELLDKMVPEITKLRAERDAAARASYLTGAGAAFREAADLLSEAGVETWARYFLSRSTVAPSVIATQREASNA